MDIMLQRIIELLGTQQHGAAKALADSIGVPANLISDWKGERSKSYTKYAPKIAEYYGVSLDWLSGLTDEKTPKEKPATITDDELNEINSIFSQLSPDNRSKLLELAHLYLTAQRNNEEKR